MTPAATYAKDGLDLPTAYVPGIAPQQDQDCDETTGHHILDIAAGVAQSRCAELLVLLAISVVRTEAVLLPPAADLP